MSIFDKAWKKTKDKAKEGYNKAKKEVEKDTGKVKRGVEKGAKQSVKEVGNIGMDVIDDVKDLAKQAKELKKRMDWAGRQITEWRDETLPEMNKKLDDIPKQIENKAEKVFDDWLKKLEKAFTKEGLKFVQKMVRAAKEGVDDFEEDDPELVAELNAWSPTIGIGPVDMTWSGFIDRADTIIEKLDGYINKPPKLRRKDIFDLFEALGPTSIDPGFDVRAALGASSSALEIRYKNGAVSLKLFRILADKIFDALGVPE